MTRMIERWFPCAEVSANSDSGWGSGNQERNLFTWFAARPTAQAKAAVVCSLLRWPADESEQDRLQQLVKSALTGRYAAWAELRREIARENPEGVTVVDPFSGRGIIPLEAARLGLDAYVFDYSPVAVIASSLLTDFPFRHWDDEPPLPFRPEGVAARLGDNRLLVDAELVIQEVGRRYSAAMSDYYPRVDGVLPWGYLWAVTLPCQECGNRFPLVGSYELRRPKIRRGRKGAPAVHDTGQSFYIDTKGAAGTFAAVVHEGPPRRSPTLSSASDKDGRKMAGKSAVCPFCQHVHPLSLHRRLTNEGYGEDVLLVVAEIDPDVGKTYRTPTDAESAASSAASAALAVEPPFTAILPAVPNESIAAGNNNIIAPVIYGARTFGDFCTDRQTLGLVRLARTINDLGEEMVQHHRVSDAYARALVAYAGSVLARKIRRSTRGVTLQPSLQKITDLYANEGSLVFSYDFFEAGIGDGPGTWNSVSANTLSTLRGLFTDIRGTPATVERCSAALLPLPARKATVVATDPPYDEMIAYGDSSDLFFVWLKRALASTWPELAVTSDPHGAQEKTEEIIVKRVRGEAPLEHRNREHYDRLIARAFSEMRRVVRDDGVVTIVFGHGEPEVWQRLLSAISSAGLVMTGSWPANTEFGGHQGKANIETTLTMCCRPAPIGLPSGRRAAVAAEVKAEVKARYPSWERWGLAPTDMLMASAGPAMEVVGRYSGVLDARGDAVDISAFLPLARNAVQEAMSVEIDHHPLETFDARTRFALWWVRLFGRSVAAKSELRWQALAASMDISDVRDLIPDMDGGCALVSAAKHKAGIGQESSVIDVALALGRTSDAGLEAMGEVLVAAGRDQDDVYLWAALKFLAERLPDSDSDGIAFTRVLRSRSGLGNVVQVMEVAHETATKKQAAEDAQLKLM